MSTGIRGGMPLAMADGTLSRKLWHDFPWESSQSIHFKGTRFYDNFTEGLGKWTTFIDTGGTITPSIDNTDDEFGSIELTTDADDNQAVEMQAGQAGDMVKFVNPATSAPYDVYFECRFSLGTLVGNSFIGLMAYTTPAGDHITDAGALADTGFIGFSTLEATPTVVNFTYKKSGQTVQVPITTIETLSADEVLQVGFSYRPTTHPTSRWITVYEANVRGTTGITKASVQAATFPAAVLMCPTIAYKNVTDISTMRVEWIAAGMVPC